MTGGFDSTLVAHNALLAVVVAGYSVIYLGIRLVASRRATADPWDAEFTKGVEDSAALPVCHRCFTPQEHQGWFCPECGAAVGRYNNWMPYVRVFSEGEVLRAGTSDLIRPSFVVIAGYLFYSVCAYFVLAPVYWYFLFRNIRKPQNKASAKNDGR